MRISVISGGTATNSLVSLYSSLSDDISYILPISDNGGSTSELIRVVGGPAIGDIRSRASRLIPSTQKQLHDLFGHRLPDNDSLARIEWGQIIDGTHKLWESIESHIKELIRPFFIEINAVLLKRARPGKEFCYSHASIGNLFLTGARIFCGSLDSAIELMLRITTVPAGIKVLPCLNTNFTHHISAVLKNGAIITGQSQISHPSVKNTSTDEVGTDIASKITSFDVTRVGTPSPLENEDAQLPFTHPALKTSQLLFSKAENQPLESPIERIYYINPYGQEIKPRASSRVITNIEESTAVILSIGSLYTSTIPVLILKGVPEAMLKAKYRILMINGQQDRETFGMTALDYIKAVVKAAGRDRDLSFITHVIYSRGLPLSQEDIEVLGSTHGIHCIQAASTEKYTESDLHSALTSILV